MTDLDLDALEARAKDNLKRPYEIRCSASHEEVLALIERARLGSMKATDWQIRTMAAEARAEAAEAEWLEQARLNGMGSEREAALMFKLERAEAEVEALQSNQAGYMDEIALCDQLASFARMVIESRIFEDHADALSAQMEKAGIDALAAYDADRKGSV